MLAACLRTISDVPRKYLCCANEIFRFDLFLDATYPITPPKMNFVLDGNDDGPYSFNPNLHNGGGTGESIVIRRINYLCF